MNEIIKQERKIISRQWKAVGLTCIMAWAIAYLGIYFFMDYAWGLFIGLPLAIGLTSSLILGYKNDVPKKELFHAAFSSLLVFCGGLLLFAWEGLICLIMVLPIAAIFTWLGYRIGYAILSSKWAGSAPVVLLVSVLSVPALMAFEDARPGTVALRAVTTSIEINASPQQVWKNVIAFPQLTEPTEFIFKTGIAFPVNATITGRGAGAVRHCNFSTGSFVEPVTVWDEPRLLRFSVVEQPAPMKELSFYDIHPNHLHGYWVSKLGQFRLTALQNGHTLLEGTTWYENKIRPHLYWTVWSDYIVHKIHKRVLAHIKVQAER